MIGASLLLSWQVRRIARAALRFAGLAALSPAAFVSRVASLRYRVQSGLSEGRLLAEGLALASEAARRAGGRPLSEDELAASAALARGTIVEFGPVSAHRLAVWPAVFFHALQQRGAHVLTVDSVQTEDLGTWLSACCRAAGLTAGVLRGSEPLDLQQAALRCDVTCGTSLDIGAAYARNRLALYQAALHPGQIPRDQNSRWRQPEFALLLDADRQLLDESRTPLLISLPQEGGELAALTRRWAAQSAGPFVLDRDYFLDRGRRVNLTSEGCERARKLPSREGMGRVPLWQRYDMLEHAIQARDAYSRDRDYVVRSGRVLFVDAATGETVAGRKLRDGLQQALEAKEGLDASVPDHPAVRLLLADICRLYARVAGITVAAPDSRAEFRELFGLAVARIENTGCPRARWQLPRAFRDDAERWRNLIADVVRAQDFSRPVLIAVAFGHDLPRAVRELRARNITAQVYRRKDPGSAPILSEAGSPGRVTVATVQDWGGMSIVPHAAAGALHVVAAGLFESARHDRKLAALAGDGTFQQFLSLDDHWLPRYFPDQLWKLQQMPSVDEAVLARHIAELRRRLERRARAERRRGATFESQRRKMLDDLGPGQHLLWPL